MSVTLRKRKNSDGTTTLRLDIYHNGVRTVETLKSLKLAKPSNLQDREDNKSLLKQAEAIRVARAAELEANNYNLVADSGRKTVVTTWLQSYVDGYAKKDKRNMQGALNRFELYLEQIGKPNLTFGNLQPIIIEEFIDYLESKSIGEGASSYYNRFKKMIKHAFKKRLMKENVLDFVEGRVKGKARKKDILTLEEIRLLSKTPIESSEVKKAFLFSCLTGLRWVDVKALRWSEVNLDAGRLKITQSKTNQEIILNLNETAMKLIGSPEDDEKCVFDLPSANGANKTLKAWVKRAKIKKAITWHNARHSFGTNLIFNDVPILTASKLLGHASLKHTQRYVDAAEELQINATNKLNIEL